MLGHYAEKQQAFTGAIMMVMSQDGHNRTTVEVAYDCRRGCDYRERKQKPFVKASLAQNKMNTCVGENHLQEL